MKKWEIPNAGMIEFELLENFEKNTSVIEELLETIIKGITKNSVIYYKKTKNRDHAFVDSEGELHSIVIQSIAELTPVFKTEFPVWRNYSKTKSGNIDFWIYHKNMAFALELKLAHKGSFRGNCCIKRSIYDHFNEGLKQLENIEKDDILYFMSDKRHLIKIVFEEIIFYTKTRKIDKDLLKDYQGKIRKSFNTLFDYTKPNPKNLIFIKEPNMKALWFLDKEIAFLRIGRFPENRAFPCVGFISRIDFIGN